MKVNTKAQREFLLENIPIGVYKITRTPTDGSALVATALNNEEVKKDDTKNFRRHYIAKSIHKFF